MGGSRRTDTVCLDMRAATTGSRASRNSGQPDGYGRRFNSELPPGAVAQSLSLTRVITYLGSALPIPGLGMAWIIIGVRRPQATRSCWALQGAFSSSPASASASPASPRSRISPPEVGHAGVLKLGPIRPRRFHARVCGYVTQPCPNDGLRGRRWRPQLCLDRAGRLHPPARESRGPERKREGQGAARKEKPVRVLAGRLPATSPGVNVCGFSAGR